MQDCSNSSALAMELLQSCTKPSIYLITMLATKAVKILPCPGTPLLVENCLSNHYKTYDYALAMLLTCDSFGGCTFLMSVFQKIFSSKTYSRSYHGVGWSNWHEESNYIEWMLGWLCDLDI